MIGELAITPLFSTNINTDVMKFILENPTGDQFILIDSTGESTPEEGSLLVGTAFFLLGSPGQNFLLLGSEVDDNILLYPSGYYRSGTKRLLTDINLLTDTLKIRLLNNGYLPNQNHTVASDTDFYIADNSSDILIDNKSWVDYGSYSGLSFSALTYQPTGEVTSLYWVMFDDTLVDKPLICYGTFDINTPMALTIVDGSVVTFSCSDDGFFGVTV